MRYISSLVRRQPMREFRMGVPHLEFPPTPARGVAEVALQSRTLEQAWTSFCVDTRLLYTGYNNKMRSSI